MESSLPADAKLAPENSPPDFLSCSSGRFRVNVASVTSDQVEARKAKAVRFLRDVVGDDDRADEVEDESAEDYASRKGWAIKNTAQRRRTNMANGHDMTKADMQDVCDQAQDILTDAYTPESSREDLAAAIGDALDLLENGPADDTDGDDGNDGDDGDDDDAGN